MASLLIPPVRRHEPRAPVAIHRTDTGSFILDFEVNQAMQCELKIETDGTLAGTALRLRHAEQVDDAGARDETTAPPRDVRRRLDLHSVEILRPSRSLREGLLHKIDVVRMDLDDDLAAAKDQLDGLLDVAPRGVPDVTNLTLDERPTDFEGELDDLTASLVDKDTTLLFVLARRLVENLDRARKLAARLVLTTATPAVDTCLPAGTTTLVEARASSFVTPLVESFTVATLATLGLGARPCVLGVVFDLALSRFTIDFGGSALGTDARIRGLPALADSRLQPALESDEFGDALTRPREERRLDGLH